MHRTFLWSKKISHKVYTSHDNEFASEMFLDSLAGTGGGSTTVFCNCGINHYATYSTFYDEDIDFPKESETVKHHESESIYFYIVEGSNFVYDCDGCRKYLKRYETFIWNQRDIIRSYLNIRIDQEFKWAEHEKLMNKLMDAYGEGSG